MKATGIVRRMDNLGRIVLPVELRRTMSIKTGDPIEIFAQSDSIVFMKYKEKCYICGSEDELTKFKGKQICKKCINQLILRGSDD